MLTVYTVHGEYIFLGMHMVESTFLGQFGLCTYWKFTHNTQYT